MDDEKAILAMSYGDRAVMIGILEMLVEKNIATSNEIAEMIERRCSRSMDLIDQANASDAEIEQEMGRYLSRMADSFRD